MQSISKSFLFTRISGHVHVQLIMLVSIYSERKICLLWKTKIYTYNTKYEKDSKYKKDEIKY